jgi:hypothetical protein
MSEMSNSPLLFRGGAARLCSLLLSRSGVGTLGPCATQTTPTPTPWSLSDQSGGLIPPRLKGRGL